MKETKSKDSSPLSADRQTDKTHVHTHTHTNVGRYVRTCLAGKEEEHSEELQHIVVAVVVSVADPYRALGFCGPRRECKHACITLHMYNSRLS